MSDTAFLASSVAGSKNGPERARLNTHTDSKGSGDWAAKENNDIDSQWLQIDLGELVQVTKVATQGKQDADHWIIQFSLSYSLDGRHWAEYKENRVARVSQYLNFIHALFLGEVKLPRKISTCSRGLCQSYHLNPLIDTFKCSRNSCWLVRVSDVSRVPVDKNVSKSLRTSLSLS